MAVSKNNIPTINDMFQAMPMNNGVMAQPPIAEERAELSVDQDFFHKIHNIEIGEKSNKDLLVREKEEAIIVEKEEKEKQEALRDGATAATAELKEMMSFNGYEFSVEAMQETAGEALSDFERLMREKGWSEEQSETIHEALVVLHDPNSTREERVQAFNKMNKSDPDYGTEFARDAQEKDGELENKVDPTQTASISETQRQAEISSSINNGNEDSTFDNFTKAQTTGTTASFNAEVNVASNDIEPQVKVAELAPAPF